MPTGPKKIPTPKNYNSKPRPSAVARGYGSDHQKLRSVLLKKYPICQACQTAWSTDLHHIDGDTRNRHPANCFMVCEACHHGRIHGERP